MLAMADQTAGNELAETFSKFKICFVFEISRATPGISASKLYVCFFHPNFFIIYHLYVFFLQEIRMNNRYSYNNNVLISSGGKNC